MKVLIDGNVCKVTGIKMGVFTLESGKQVLVDSIEKVVVDEMPTDYDIDCKEDCVKVSWREKVGDSCIEYTSELDPHGKDYYHSGRNSYGEWVEPEEKGYICESVDVKSFDCEMFNEECDEDEFFFTFEVDNRISARDLNDFFTDVN